MWLKLGTWQDSSMQRLARSSGNMSFKLVETPSTDYVTLVAFGLRRHWKRGIRRLGESRRGSDADRYD